MSKSVGSRMEGSASMPNGPVSAPAGPSLGPPPPASGPQSSLTEITEMWLKFGKTFVAILPIYILGYLEFSFSWVLIGLAALFYWKRAHGGKDYRINRALAFLEHEDKVVKQILPTTELPSWVHYPDVERVEWLNKTVKQMWPFICQFVDKLFRETIEPAVQGANPHLSSFCFSKIDLGNKPFRVNGVKVYTENVDKRQVIMDMQISFVGNTEIDVDIKKYYCRAGIKSIRLHGVMRVVMEPLLGDIPLIGALSVFFLKKPLLDINWTGLTNVLDIPGINGLSDSLIQDIIYSFLVLPNRITIPLVGEAQLSRLLFPVPQGILRIHFLEAQDLLGKDKFLGGLIKGKSDPYGVIRVGNQLFQSKVIHETVNPKWNAVYEAEVMDPEGQNLEVQLYDEDTDKDDMLGSVTIDLGEVVKEQKVDEWFTLDDVASGKLHLKLEWLSLLSTPDKLDQALASIRADRGKANDGLSSALLVVSLDSARNLPAGKKVTSDPSPFVQLRVGHKSHESKTRYKTNEPVWEEAFSFLIHNPRTQDLEVEVKDAKHDNCSLGILILPLGRLLEAEDMTLNQQFLLRNSGPSCSLKMKIALRVLCLDRDASFGVDQASSGLKSSTANLTPRPSELSDSAANIPRSYSVSGQDGLRRRRESEQEEPDSRLKGGSLAERGRSSSHVAIMGSQHFLDGGKEATPSIASDISYPFAAQELQQRLQQMQNGSGPSYFPLGEIQLTVRHSSQRNKLVVVVHACRNLISFSDHGSDPYVRLYLLPDKRRSGRRKTHTFKKTLNPIYDQTFEFSVSLVELHRRTLDVAVKNSGGLLSRHKGLLGKVLVKLGPEDAAKGWTQWYELTEDGQTKTHLI
ncbi:extended synaptotagmin-2-like isoform X4 [Hippocampus zosterae]|uniref:extended synaptotagmin-2-like isoform X4 n=1 Tax=Hippocampus zosterae TaxID=109293 RepID=UPI00223E06A0|nr:extended synaptotagmin-2-like isoform X4 [Hippocampus zosterae]